MQNTRGRPNLKSNALAEWLRAQIIDSPKLASDLIVEARHKFDCSEITVNRVWRDVRYELNGETIGPWKAFQHGRHWFWGDSRRVSQIIDEVVADPFWMLSPALQRIVLAKKTAEEMEVYRDEMLNDKRAKLKKHQPMVASTVKILDEAEARLAEAQILDEDETAIVDEQF